MKTRKRNKGKKGRLKDKDEQSKYEGQTIEAIHEKNAREREK